MKQFRKLNRNLLREIIADIALDVAIYTIWNYINSLIKNVFFWKKNKCHTSKVYRKKAMSSLSIKQSSNVISETILDENSDHHLGSIYQLLNWNSTPPVTVFFTISDYTLSIEKDTEASIRVFKDTATDMRYFAKSKFSRSLVHKKSFSLIWQVVFKLGYVFCQER